MKKTWLRVFYETPHFKEHSLSRKNSYFKYKKNIYIYSKQLILIPGFLARWSRAVSGRNGGLRRRGFGKIAGFLCQSHFFLNVIQDSFLTILTRTRTRRRRRDARLRETRTSGVVRAGLRRRPRWLVIAIILTCVMIVRWSVLFLRRHFCRFGLLRCWLIT